MSKPGNKIAQTETWNSRPASMICTTHGSLQKAKVPAMTRTRRRGRDTHASMVTARGSLAEVGWCFRRPRRGASLRAVVGATRPDGAPLYQNPPKRPRLCQGLFVYLARPALQSAAAAQTTCPPSTCTPFRPLRQPTLKQQDDHTPRPIPIHPFPVPQERCRHHF